MTNPKNDPLLLEIQDEINRENLTKFFNKYGSAIVLAGIIFLLAVAGYEAWSQYSTKQSAVAGTQVYKVISNSDKPQDEFALKTLDNAAKSSGYYGIAILNKAAIQVKNNDFAGAITSFDSVAKDSHADKALRDLAGLNAANLLLNTNPKADGLEKRITDLTADDNSFKYSAREMLAAYYLQNNQQQKANDVLQKLASDANTPVSIAQRAKEFLPAKLKEPEPQQNDE